MKPFLVRFSYEHYFQGWEQATETVLVYADTFENACVKISYSKLYDSCKNFQNMTLE